MTAAGGVTDLGSGEELCGADAERFSGWFLVDLTLYVALLAADTVPVE